VRDEKKSNRSETVMTIEKKSLISSLKTTKKANVAKEDFSQVGSANSGVKSPAKRMAGRMYSAKVQPARVAKGKAAPAKITSGRSFKGKAAPRRTLARLQ
jgi:hypothetical protein